MVVRGKQEYRWKWFPVVLLVAPYVIWASNRAYFGDTETYRRGFLSIPMSLTEFPAYMVDQSKDVGFAALSFVLKQVLGNQDVLFFFLIATFQMFCVAYFFRKYSPNFLLCFFMFVASTDYLSWMFNGMRQFIAVCITLLCFGLILKKKYVAAMIVVCLASTVHGSALLMLPVLFVVQGEAWNKRTLWMAIAIAVAVTFVEQFTSILGDVLADTQYSTMLKDEIWTTDDGTNMLRVLFYSIPAIMAFLGRKHIQRANDPVINLCTNYGIVTALFYVLSAFTSGIYMGRLPIYTTFPGYVVTVWLLERMFTRDSVRIAKGMLIGVYLVFFYYQMHIGWGLL